MFPTGPWAEARPPPRRAAVGIRNFIEKGRRKMKKRLLSLALALSLCMGLCVPALAADVSGLDAKGAKAYYDKLFAYKDVVIYADLKDMNGDKSPELVVVSSPAPDDEDSLYYSVTLDIWQVKSEAAAKTSSVECEAATAGDMGLCFPERDNLLVCVCVHRSSGGPF